MALPFVYIYEKEKIDWPYMWNRCVSVVCVGQRTEIHFSMVCLTRMVGLRFFVHHSVNSVRTRILLLFFFVIFLFRLFFTVCLPSRSLCVCLFSILTATGICSSVFCIVWLFSIHSVAIGCACVCEVHFVWMKFHAVLKQFRFLQYFYIETYRIDPKIQNIGVAFNARQSWQKQITDQE